jgi:hypothetical protein
MYVSLILINHHTATPIPPKSFSVKRMKRKPNMELSVLLCAALSHPWSSQWMDSLAKKLKLPPNALLPP